MPESDSDSDSDSNYKPFGYIVLFRLFSITWTYVLGTEIRPKMGIVVIGNPNPNPTPAMEISHKSHQSLR